MKLNTNLLPTVLLLDDDTDDCNLFKEAMAEIFPRIAIICLRSADLLMKTIEDMKPSMIFIDFHLPRVNGIECVQQLKDHPDFKAIPVFMWSTSSILQNVVAAYKAGVHYYFEKPWDFRLLVDKLKKIIRHNTGVLEPVGHGAHCVSL